MSKFRELRFNPPKLSVKKDATDVVVELISCMCDNRYLFRFIKKESGQFKLSTGRFAYSNFQIKHDKYELEWAADENNWDEVFKMINSGTSAVASVKSR